MKNWANAIVQIVPDGFPRFVWVAWMFLFASTVSMAQLESKNVRPGSIRDRLFSPKISPRSIKNDGMPFGRGIDTGARKQDREVGNQLANVNRGLTVPYWSDSFSYLGITYKYSMVGTDPKRGSATTIVPTVIIPMRFVFENGAVFDASADNIDGQTSVQGIIGSPVFQNYDFVTGGTHVGNTQYADAFQRANFWDSVSRKSPNYHVLLGQPTVAPAYEVFVPTSLVNFLPEGNGSFLAVIDEDFLQQATIDAIAQANVSPQDLAIIAWGDVQGTFTAGYHRMVTSAVGTQTYIATGYHPRIPFFRFTDSLIFSHEAIEWMDDPFSNYNFTPGWSFAFIPYPRCLSELTDDELEVGDVFELTPAGNIEVNTSNGVYHLQEGAFIDYFTRSRTSRSVNGQYSFFGVASGPSADCVGHLEVQPTLIEFPGAVATVATGINDHGQIVGLYLDQSGALPSFVYDHGQYTRLDYPGAIETDVYGINNSGQMSGTYFDIAGIPHGFVYSSGTFYKVDFPGAIDAFAFGINSCGDIVGGYDDASAITRGFTLQNGQFHTVDAPFGSQTQVLSTNNLGQMVGYVWDDPSAFGGFILNGSGFTRFDYPTALDTFPNAINDQGEHGGVFDDFSPFYGDVEGFGYVTINGRPYSLYYYLLGMNNQNQIVGNAFNFITNRRVGFVATLPGH